MSACSMRGIGTALRGCVTIASLARDVRTPAIHTSDALGLAKLPTLVSIPEPAGLLHPPRAVNPSADDRGTAGRDRARAPDLDPNYSLERVRPLHHALVLDGEGATSRSAATSIKGCVERAPYLFHDLSLSSARRERDASNQNLQSTIRRRALIRQRVRPVRPGGTPTTDSSCPMLAPHAPSSRDESGRVTLASTPLRVAWRRCGRRKCALPRAHPASPRLCPNGSRSIRLPGIALTFHETRLAARTPRAL